MKKVVIIGSPRVHQNYQAALEKAGCSAVIFPDLSYVEKHSDDFDGLLLPGGGDVFCSLNDYTGTPVFLSDDLRLTLEQLDALDLFYKMNKPIFGICKGMQLINLYFHGTIKEVSNRKLHQHPKKDIFHPADNLPGNFLHALFGPHMLVNSCHHQCVDSLGQNIHVTQTAPDGTIEALLHLSDPVFGTQWHPERMPEISGQNALLLFRYFVSLL